MSGKRLWPLLIAILIVCDLGIADDDDFNDNDDDSDDDDISYPTLSPNASYCFEFTWFGPEYDKNSQYNGTCDDYKDESRAGENIPCASPIVISDNGTIPDINYLWKNHKASVLCRRAENQACVTYTYWYNGLVTNQTHMCARVRTSSTTIPYDCFKQKINGYEIEMCVCKSGLGFKDMPCNSGGVFANSLAFAIVLVSFLGLIL